MTSTRPSGDPCPPGPGIELPRTFLHLIWGTALALAYWFFLPRIWVLAVTGAFITLLVVLEWLRGRYLRRGRPRRPKVPAPGDIDKQLSFFARLYARVAGPYLRPRERSGDWVAALAALVGYFTVTLLFDRPIAVVAILVTAIGDPVARGVGRRFGTIHITGRRTRKSIEGLGALAIVAWVTTRVFGMGAGGGFAAAAAAVGGDILSCFDIGELLIDDNLVVPVLIGTALWAVSLVSS
jgi:dolichol kinase